MSTVPRVPSAIPGQPPSLGSALAHCPELARAFHRLYGTLWSDGVVSQAIKETARVAESLRFQEAMDLVTTSTLPTVATLYSSEDEQEGFRAFAEKRPPVRKGR